jgi:hypothetical protein
MRTVPWRQAATAWGRPSDLDLGVNNSHHQSRADAVVWSSCIGPCSCSNRSNPTRSRLPPFATLITPFDMGSHNVLQVLGRSGRVNEGASPPPRPSAKNAIKPSLLTAAVPSYFPPLDKWTDNESCCSRSAGRSSWKRVFARAPYPSRANSKHPNACNHWGRCCPLTAAGGQSASFLPI